MDDISTLFEEREKSQAAIAAAQQIMRDAVRVDKAISDKLFAAVEPIVIAKDQETHKSLGRPELIALRPEGSEIVATLGFFGEDDFLPFQEANLRFQKKDLIAAVLARQSVESQPSEDEATVARKVGFRRPGR